MELKLIARIIQRYWWLILLPMLVSAAIVLPGILSSPAASGGYSTAIVYSAAQLPEAQPPRDGDYQDIWLASELAVNALTAWVQTPSFRAELQKSAPALDLTTLGISADNQRSVGQLFLSHPDADTLSAIATAAIDVLQTRNADYFPQVGTQAAQVTILGAPQITAAPPPLVNRFGPVIRIGLGLIAGLVLAGIAYYMDPYIRHRDEVEAQGVRVLGTLPRD